MELTDRRKKNTTANSTYKKLAVQWLNEVLCFVSSSVVADNFVLRNRQLLVAANRYHQAKRQTMLEANLKQHFDNILKMTIAPALKEMGFKKKGQHFSRKVNDIYQCINIQKSKWNSYNESLSFTVNIGFYSELLDKILRNNEIQVDFPKTTDCFIQGRLGNISHSRDHWYELNDRIKFESVNAEVKYDIEKYLKTHFKEHNSLDNLIELVQKNTKSRTHLISPISQFVFLMTTNQTQFAIKELRKEYKNALTPQSTTQTINYPDGTSKVYTSKPYINQSFIDSIENFAKYYDIELQK